MYQKANFLLAKIAKICHSYMISFAVCEHFISKKTKSLLIITIYLVKIIRFIELPVKASTLKIVSSTTIYPRRAMTWNARSQTLTFWEGSTGSGWLVDGLNTPLPRTLVWRNPPYQRGADETFSPTWPRLKNLSWPWHHPLAVFEEDAAIHHLTEEQKSLLTTWDRLSPSQRTAILDLIQAFLPE